MNRLWCAPSAKAGKSALWALAAALAPWLLPAAMAETAVPAGAPPGDCSAPGDPTATTSGGGPGVPCPPAAAWDPAVWGVFDVTGYAAGTHEAPNGFAFDPLVALSSDFNFGLLPRKQLYLFLENGLWVQRTARVAPGKSQREFDADFGVAWNYFDALELRASAYSLNNLNRGTSLASPDGYKDGIAVENRYYFGPSDIYDVGRLSFVSLGYYPTKALVGNNGQSFRPGLFAQGYLTQDLPTPFRSYLYGGLRLTAQDAATPRLLETDLGVAFRPVADRQGLEFRVGYDRTDDVQAHVAKNLVYGAVRLGFGMNPSNPSPGALSPVDLPSSYSAAWPQAWGVIGLPVYATGTRMAPNGVPFTPIFGVTSELNLGLLSDRELYLFWDGAFWAQHSGAGITNANQGGFDFSKREMDSELGLAWNYFDALEIRASGYALNNLNRGVSLSQAAGGKQGIKLENRYYFPSPNPYDVGRSSFISLGYIPTENLVGGNGASFRPGAFARAYLARDLPIPWFHSYLYADMQAISEQTSELRLFETDVGWAVRPFSRWQNLELRVGDNLTADVDANATRNVVYGAVRLEFGPGGFDRPTR